MWTFFLFSALAFQWYGGPSSYSVGLLRFSFLVGLVLSKLAFDMQYCREVPTIFCVCVRSVVFVVRVIVGCWCFSLFCSLGCRAFFLNWFSLLSAGRGWGCLLGRFSQARPGLVWRIGGGIIDRTVCVYIFWVVCSVHVDFSPFLLGDPKAPRNNCRRICNFKEGGAVHYFFVALVIGLGPLGGNASLSASSFFRSKGGEEWWCKRFGCFGFYSSLVLTCGGGQGTPHRAYSWSVSDSIFRSHVVTDRLKWAARPPIPVFFVRLNEHCCYF